MLVVGKLDSKASGDACLVMKTPDQSDLKSHMKAKSHRFAEGSVEVRLAERRQVAALPYRKTTSGRIEVLLITSRETGRFIIPKGWPMKRLSDSDAAAKEAYEETGVVGKVKPKPIGTYSYWKRLERTFELLRVDVYALKVKKQRANWPEKEARTSRWLPARDAAQLIDDPELVTLIDTFRD
jgi:8-oxo-dGTP pyrophosphatase MutT (NUDIX family)